MDIHTSKADRRTGRIYFWPRTTFSWGFVDDDRGFQSARLESSSSRTAHFMGSLQMCRCCMRVVAQRDAWCRLPTRIPARTVRA